MRLLVFSTPREGMDAEYNEWYTGTHIPEMLAVPGVLSCTRHRLVRGGDGEARYLAVHDIDDAHTVLRELGERAADGRMAVTAAADPARTRITVWEQI
ncbi:DUF4286 family protein [Nocardia sp. CDC186]|uniref:DUF4286 family protein n=1 Tax=Nocardia implantans TaxID=3108168 RepID=A0ABU6AV76_9NOCA|nr:MULTISPECIES: DUF4286 family protein [unclassified Nocardia]MBF6192411.1 hypothetical protein [Nocardia beijingensis]MEA3527686.1 DUF4286 family protein [Nocardia sp. CDC192]MEB3511394.1 DUF4286 family protein [Nocardia sp. CDC186]